MKILIVDDEEIQRRKLARLISESSISFSDILCAPDVPGAIEIIESQHPSIVLSDIRMPVKDGLELTQYIQESYPEILVILVTGYSEFEYAQAAIRYNVFDYILKPIDPESTLSCIRHATAKLESIKRRENNYKVLQNYFNENVSYIRNQFLQELLFWPSPLSEEQLLVQKDLLHINITNFRLVVLKCHLHTDAVSNQIEEKYYYSHLAELAIKKRDSEALLYNIGDILYWIYPSDNNGISNYAMMKDMELLLNELDGNDVIFQISISSLSNNFNQLNTLRRQITICQSHYENHSDDLIIFYDDLSTQSYDLFNVHEKTQFLSTQILAGNTKEAIKCLDSFTSDLSGNKIISEEIFFFLLSSCHSLDSRDKCGQRIGCLKDRMARFAGWIVRLAGGVALHQPLLEAWRVAERDDRPARPGMLRQHGQAGVQHRLAVELGAGADGEHVLRVERLDRVEDVRPELGTLLLGVDRPI